MLHSPIESYAYLQKKFLIKREDLIGGLFNGIKQRKISSIVDEIIRLNPKKIVIKGSFQSNFVIAITLQLLPLKIPIEFYFHRFPSSSDEKGNFFFLKQIIGNASIFSMESFGLNHLNDAYIIEEGGDQLAGYLGLLSLGEELISQIKNQNLTLEEIWVDAGTGSSAICLLYTLSKNDLFLPLQIVSMHDDAEQFEKRRKEIFFKLNTHFNDEVTHQIPYAFYRPTIGRSFGSTNNTLFKFIKAFAKETGVFLDPIYSAKLFMTFLEKGKVEKSLLIHSGGTLSLTGFFEPFRALKD